MECVGPDGLGDLTADRIVLSAGAIGSAHLLLLSGIGPEDDACGRGYPGRDPTFRSGCGRVDHPEWVLPVDWTPHPRSPPLEAVLSLPNGLEIRPYTRGFGAMVEGAGEDPPTGRTSALR